MHASFEDRVPLVSILRTQRREEVVNFGIFYLPIAENRAA